MKSRLNGDGLIPMPTFDSKRTFRTRGGTMVSALALLCLAPGCEMSNEDFVKYLNDPDAERVAAQICLPNRTSFFDTLRIDVTDMPANLSYNERARMYGDARETRKYENQYKSTSASREYQEIRQWRKPKSEKEFPRPWISFGQAQSHDGLGSAGSGAQFISDSTMADQPVFFAYTHERPKDLLGVNVILNSRRNGADEQRTFWFKPPRDIPKTGYTTWLAPVSEEGRDEKFPIFWLLTHGKEMPVYAVGEDAPRIRYTLLTKRQFWAGTEEGRRAMDLEKLRHLVEDAAFKEDEHHLVPRREVPIPPC